MSAVKKERDVVFNYSYADVFNATIDVAGREKITVKFADMNTGYLRLTTSVSLWSWGEDIEIWLRPDQQNTTFMHITSDSALATTLIDFGRNNKLIDKIVNGVNLVLFNHYQGRQY